MDKKPNKIDRYVSIHKTENRSKNMRTDLLECAAKLNTLINGMIKDKPSIVNEPIFEEMYTTSAKLVSLSNQLAIIENTTTENNGVDLIKSLKPVLTEDNFGIIG